MKTPCTWVIKHGGIQLEFTPKLSSVCLDFIVLEVTVHVTKRGKMLSSILPICERATIMMHLARHASWCNSIMTIMEVSNHFLLVFKAQSTLNMYTIHNDGQESVPRLVRKNWGEFTTVTLLSEHRITQNPNDITISVDVSFLQPHQRSFYLQ